MKTIADFKQAMTVGSKWIFTAHWWPEPIARTCMVSDSVKFGLTSPKDPQKTSYCDWPKKAEVLALTENSITIRGEGFPEYHFLTYTQID